MSHQCRLKLLSPSHGALPRGTEGADIADICGITTPGAAMMVVGITIGQVIDRTLRRSTMGCLMRSLEALKSLMKDCVRQQFNSDTSASTNTVKVYDKVGLLRVS